MNQHLRICIYFILTAGLSYAMVRYIPFKFQASKWQIKVQKELPAASTDTLLANSISIDSIEIQKTEIQKDSAIVEKDTCITTQYLSSPSAFTRQLEHLHHQLINTAKSKKNIRILYIGDSQIEGDRITAYLRESFQERFGGSGPGLTMVYDPQHINPSVWIDNKGDWNIHSIFNRKHRLQNKSYGLMGQTASLKANSPGVFKISASKWAEQHASHYQKVRLFFAPHTDTLNIKGSIKNTEVINDLLPPSNALTEINWEFKQLSPSLTFELNSKSDIHILGCALDSICGVTVDNISLRGQSSPMLHNTNGELFKAMAEHLDIGMVIYQFGTNMIPTIAKNYRFYQIQMAKQFDLIKEYLPNTPVLVIGISDAAHNSQGKIESYKHLPLIISAQQEITNKYGFAFFNLYEAMGGEGTMLNWSQKEPAWALSDYIHFTRLGGQHVSTLLSDALWQQFDLFETTNTLLTPKAINDERLVK